MLTPFSAMNEASFEGALLDSLNSFQPMWISNGKGLPKGVDRKLKPEFAAGSNLNLGYFSLRRTAQISSALPSGRSKRTPSLTLDIAKIEINPRKRVDVCHLLARCVFLSVLLQSS